MEKIWVNSGDSHYMEPPDFWQQALPPKLAERMPRSVKDPDERWETVYVDGQTLRRPIPLIARRRDADGLTMVERNMTRAPGVTDLKERIKDQDNEGVWGEIIYPSLGMWNTIIKDPVLVREAVKGSNAWCASELQGFSPRFIAPAQVSMLSVDDAVAEVERAAGIGLKAVFMPSTPPEGIDDLHEESWDPLWSAIEDAGMVVTFHIGGSSEDISPYRGRGGAIMNWVAAAYGGQKAVYKLVASGVLDRHPGIKVLVSEGGASWVPFLGDRMNEAYRQLGMFVKPKLSLTPKEILYRQVYASFQHDETAVQALTGMGYQNVMWGSDYPHVEGTFGHTQETLHELFDGEPEEVRRRVTIGSFLDLFPQVGEPPVESAAA